MQNSMIIPYFQENYFYPDLPKSYQITQDKTPIIYDGFLMIDDKKIGIERAHLEEDAGKSQHLMAQKNHL